MFQISEFLGTFWGDDPFGKIVSATQSIECLFCQIHWDVAVANIAHLVFGGTSVFGAAYVIPSVCFASKRNYLQGGGLKWLGKIRPLYSNRITADARNIHSKQN